MEDDEGVRRSIVMWLETEGYKVVEAASAEDALVTFAALGTPPDAALLDVKLPGMNGFELADHLENDHGFRKVVFVTAFYWEEETRRQLIRREKPYFEKPLKFQQQVLPFLSRYLGPDQTIG